MSFLINKCTKCIVSTTIQFKRFRGKINIQRPRAPHYERARVLRFVQPIYINEKKNAPIIDLCTKPLEAEHKKEVDYNPLEIIFAKECLNWFNHSKMIIFFHKNAFNKEETFEATVKLRKENMYLIEYGKKIVTKALQGSKYEPVLKIYNSHNLMIFSPDVNVSKMLKVMKKYPQLIMLAGIVDDRFLSHSEVLSYAKLPNLQTMQSNLANVLNMAALSLTNNLTLHQSNLVSSLEQYVKIKSSEQTDNTEKSSTENNSVTQETTQDIVNNVEDKKE